MEYFAATNKKPSSKRPVGANTYARRHARRTPHHLPQKLRAQPRAMRISVRQRRLGALTSFARSSRSAATSTRRAGRARPPASSRRRAGSTPRRDAARARRRRDDRRVGRHRPARGGRRRPRRACRCSSTRVRPTGRCASAAQRPRRGHSFAAAGCDVAPAAGPTPLAAALATGALDCRASASTRTPTSSALATRGCRRSRRRRALATQPAHGSCSRRAPR